MNFDYRILKDFMTRLYRFIPSLLILIFFDFDSIHHIA